MYVTSATPKPDIVGKPVNVSLLTYELRCKSLHQSHDSTASNTVTVQEILHVDLYVYKDSVTVLNLLTYMHACMGIS